ncbi:MAG: serine hydrolase [Ignavibacteria bacterium]
MKKLLTFLLFILTFYSCSSQKELSLIKLTTSKNYVQLEQEILKLANTYSGRIGLYAKNLRTNEEIKINSDTLFPTASVIKLPILITLFDKSKNNEIDVYKEIIIPSKEKVGGAGVIQYFNGDTKLKLIDAATLMIILSDNTATNAVIDQFAKDHDDKLNTINSTMEKLGLKNTKLLNKVFSYSTKKNTPEAKRFGLGYSTPFEMGKLLEMIYNHQIIDSFYSEWIINILKNQQDDTMIRRFLPYDQLKENETIIVANKTGAVDRARIDVGIVYSPKCDFVIAIFADESNDTSWTHDNKAQNAVAKAARLIYDYFNQ